MNFKFFTLHIVVFLAWGALTSRAFVLQLTPNEKLSSRIESQFASNVKVNAKRGDIFDKNGNILATSVSTWSAFIDPLHVTQKDRLIDRVSEVLKINRRALYKKIGKKKRFVWLKRKLNSVEYQALSKLGFKGIGFVEEYSRVYFNSESTSFLVGKTDIDGNGLSGIELKYNEVLQGKPLRFKTLRDGKGRPLVFSNEHILDDLKGGDVYLNIDIESQVFFAKALKERVKEAKAKRGWGLLIEAKTGKILSSVQYNSKKRSGFEKNLAISEIHEPGSILKTFSFVQAMSKLGIKPSQKFSCGNDGYLIGKRKIRNSHKEKCKKMTLLQAFSRSLNTVSADLALKLGADKLINKYVQLGFDKKTGVDFPGEVSPIFHKKLSGKHHLASLSFGHGVSLSAIQVAQAYAALANGGDLIQPAYVDKTFNKDSFEKERRKIKSEVLSTKEIFLAQGILASVLTKEGTGHQASVPGYLVGGKTGTSQKTDLKNGGYTKDVLSSFVGLFPLSKPEYVALVMIDEPTLPRSGGAVAGPVFAKIASYVLQKNQILPDKINMKNVRNLAELSNKFKSKTSKGFKTGLVPDLKGYSLREAIQLSKNLELKFKVRGSGKVKTVSPKPGHKLPKSKMLSLVLE